MEDQSVLVSERTEAPPPTRMEGDERHVSAARVVVDLESLAEWKLAQRVASSRHFAKSELLPKFLLRVCELKLQGRAHEITEHRMGIQIFNRPASYNPSEDNIVRSYARVLRRRLEGYFAEEGRNESIRILIPRGGYVPQFESASGERRLEEPAEDPAEIQDGRTEDTFKMHGGAQAKVADSQEIAERENRRGWQPWMLVVIGLLGGVLITLAVSVRWSRFSEGQAPSTAHPLWAHMFEQSRETLIVPADAGLGILQNLAGQQITLAQYANGSYVSALRAGQGISEGSFHDLEGQRYTSVADLDITTRMARLPEYLPAHTHIRFPRNLTAEDFKGTNVILLGSRHSNPWDDLFANRLNFRFEYSATVDQSWIVNTHPLTGEQAAYRNDTDPAAGKTFGTVAYLPALEGEGHVLLIQGLNMAATQAAAELLFRPEIAPVLKQAAAADGRLKPFELLVETASIGATSPDAHLIAVRVYQ